MIAQMLYHFGIHSIVDEDTHRVETLCQGNGIPVQVRLIVFDFDSGGNGVAVKARNDVGFGIKTSKFYNLFLLLVSIVYTDKTWACQSQFCKISVANSGSGMV